MHDRLARILPAFAAPVTVAAVAATSLFVSHAPATMVQTPFGSPFARPVKPGMVPPAGPVAFSAPAEPAGVEDVARVAVVADVDRIKPGATFHIAVQFSLAHHWHTYWEFAGASGMPPYIEIKGPDGFVFGTPRFPRPQDFTGPEGVTHGYEHEAWIFVPVTAPATLPADGSTQRFDVLVDYLVCRTSCMLGTFEGPLEVPAIDAGTEAGSKVGTPMPPMRPWLARLPVGLDSVEGAAAWVTEPEAGVRSLVVRIPQAWVAGEGRNARLQFLPSPRPGVGFGDARIAPPRGDTSWTVSVPLALDADNAMGQPFVVRGIVGRSLDPKQPAIEFEVTVPSTEG